MPWSQYMRGIRGKIGDDLLVVPAAGVAAFDDNGCLLLARHVHDSLWATPGGAIEPGEAPDEAAIREFREETGLVAGRPLALIGCYGGPDFEVGYRSRARTAYVVSMYATAEVSGLVSLQGDELSAIGWFDQGSAAELALPPDMTHIVPDAFRWWTGTRRSS